MADFSSTMTKAFGHRLWRHINQRGYYDRTRGVDIKPQAPAKTSFDVSANRLAAGGQINIDGY